MHRVAGVGLAPGWHQWVPCWWAPTRACSAAGTLPGRRAVLVVMLVAARFDRTHDAGVRAGQSAGAVAAVSTRAEAGGAARRERCGRCGQAEPARVAGCPPALPAEVWFHVLGMTALHELGADQGY